MYESIIEQYRYLGQPSGRTLKKYPEFVKAVKTATAWLDTNKGRVEFKLRMKCITEGITSVPMCCVCGEHHVSNRGDDFSLTCSPKCRGELSFSQVDNHPLHSTEASSKRKETNISKYGVDNPFKSQEVQTQCKKKIQELYGVSNVSYVEAVKEKRKATNMDRYGVENATQNPDIFQRAVDTLWLNYGVTSPLKNKEIQERVKASIKAKYGVDHFTSLPEVQEKKKSTNMDKYGCCHVTQRGISKESLTILHTYDLLQSHYQLWGSISHASLDLGVDASTYASYLSKHKIDIIPQGSVSFAEREIHDILTDHGVEFTTSDRSILEGLEADIVIEKSKILIEYNGVYWHSELYKDRLYHQKKSLLAIEKGYTLIHVWEDDWNSNKELVISKILHKCGGASNRVFARKCRISEDINPKVFYNTHHIQGNINSSINISLTHDGDIVAVMSFKKYKNGWDLTRYATSCSVVGGFNKLLTYFRRKWNPEFIITFASLDYSDGSLYDKCGFERVGITPPNYHYVKNGVRYSRNMFMKHLLHKKLENFDDQLSEYENMRNHGYIRLYDAGSIKFVM